MPGTLRVVFRYRPGQTPDEARALSSVREVFESNAVDISLEAVGAESLNLPGMESLSVGDCTELFGQHEELFNATVHTLATPHDVVIFVVGTISEASGCAVHPPDCFGLVVADDVARADSTSGGQWVLAHELCHVLGLEHATDADAVALHKRLMFASPKQITEDPPEITTAEKEQLEQSDLLGIAGLAPLGPARATPALTIESRSTPVLLQERRSVFGRRTPFT